MQLVIEMINGAAGAGEPKLVLVSGDIPSYAFIRRADSEVEVLLVRNIRRLDPRSGNRKECHMVSLEVEWRNRPVNVGLCHCVSNNNFLWDWNARAAVLPNIYSMLLAQKKTAAEVFKNLLRGFLEAT